MSTRFTRLRPSFPKGRVALAAALAALLLSSSPKGQSPTAQDEGALGTWQLLLKLQTTASAMHTTAHPDDEHGGVLAMLSRRDGARVSLLTLTRGESGDNALGPQLFDALGLLRTDELRIADRYYGVDDQYLTASSTMGSRSASMKRSRSGVKRTCSATSCGSSGRTGLT